MTVRPATDAQSAAPGTTITYTLQVTNAGNLVDTFDVAVSGQAWSTGVPTTVGPLAAAASAHMAVTVCIPASAADGESDAITISITSRRDETKRAIVTLTTTAQSAVPLPYKLFLPLVIKPPAG